MSSLAFRQPESKVHLLKGLIDLPGPGGQLFVPGLLGKCIIIEST